MIKNLIKIEYFVKFKKLNSLKRNSKIKIRKKSWQ